MGSGAMGLSLPTLSCRTRVHVTQPRSPLILAPTLQMRKLRSRQPKGLMQHRLSVSDLKTRNLSSTDGHNL